MKKSYCLRSFLIVIIVLTIVLTIALTAIASLIKSRRIKENDLLQNGPWSVEGIWKNSEENFYLISSYKNSAEFTEVTAYICIDGVWKALESNIGYGTTIIFLDSDGNIQITAKATLNDQILTLSQMKNEQAFKDIYTQKIELHRYLWEEQGEQLPFDLIK